MVAESSQVTALVADHVQRRPRPDVDVATFVLESLDALLATQQEIRRGLAPGRMIRPAERWHLAAASMVAARRYAADLAAALGAARGELEPTDPDGDPRRAGRPESAGAPCALHRVSRDARAVR